MGWFGENLSWWIILILLFIGIVLYFIIPWDKIYKKRQDKNDVINKPGVHIDKNSIEKSPTPMMGIYNWFGKSEALRSRSLIYVQPELDCCQLCRPFENEVLSLEEYDKKYITMSEAISKGYHHIGCKHIDIDYFPGDTKIPEKQFTKEQQIDRHNNVLEMYKMENHIRNLNYRLDNEENSEKIEADIEDLINKLKQYCKEKNLEFNSKRLKSSILDIDKFC